MWGGWINKMTEIEVRGKLAKSDFERLFELLQKEGELTDHYHRLSLDLSPGFETESKTWKNPSGTDIRLKKSDEKEKLTIKVGNFHDLERKEIEVKLQAGQFLNALDLLEALGYKTGMTYFWESWEFKYLETEVKLTKHTDDYYVFEVEGKNDSEVNEMVNKLGLTAYSKEEYRKVIDWENQNIHRVYERGAVERILGEEF
jgi:hypothetical protein